MTEGLAARLAMIESRIETACANAGRSREDVTLVAVSKGHPAETLLEAHALGLRVFGESYIQEWVDKAEQLPADLEWHFIGRLQSNKARFLADGPCHMVHSIGRSKTARKLGERCAANPTRTTPLPVLVEVNLGGEDSKGGTTIDDVREILATIDGLPALVAVGLMAIPPPGTPEETRPYFAALAALLAELNQTRTNKLTELSMGMSNDFHVAVEEGATLIRVGTALLGPRSK